MKQGGNKGKKKTTYFLAYEEIKLLHGTAAARIWHGHLKCSCICIYVHSNVIAVCTKVI